MFQFVLLYSNDKYVYTDSVNFNDDNIIWGMIIEQRNHNNRN